MNVGDLISLLEDYDPETPVLIARQPGWPLAEVVAGVVSADDRTRDADCPLHDGYLVGYPGCDWEPDDDGGRPSCGSSPAAIPTTRRRTRHDGCSPRRRSSANSPRPQGSLRAARPAPFPPGRGAFAVRVYVVRP